MSNAPTRVCRRCSAQAQTNSLNCPHCGASYLRGFKGLHRRTRVALVVLPLLLVLGGAGGAVALKLHHDDVVKHKREVAQARADAKRKAAAEEARRRAAAKRAQAAIDQVKIDERKSMEHDLRAAITKDAQKDIDEGVLDGPAISHTSCNAIAGGSDSLSEPTARYDCLAVNETSSDGTEHGYQFTGTINFNTGSYTWRLGSG
jgi:ribosomal protein L40E